MADLGTLTLGTFTNVSATAITGTEPVLQAIASAVDASYAYDATNTTHTGSATFELGTTPADFGTILTVAIQLRYLAAAAQTNTWTSLTAQIVKSDGTTPLTNEVTVASSITTTTATNSGVVTLTSPDTTATKADWDGAQVLLRWNITKIKGGDVVEKQVTAAQVTGTYTVAAVARSLDCAPGSYSVTGADATLLSGRTLNAASGSYAVTGPDATLQYVIPYDVRISWIQLDIPPPATAFTLALDAGSYALSGSPASLLRAASIAVAAGNYAIAGADATPLRTAALNAAPGTYTTTGADLGALATRALNAEPGSYFVTGTPATSEAVRSLVLAPGAYDLVGAALTFAATTPSPTLNAEPGVYSINPSAATHDLQRLLAAGSGQFAITGSDAQLLRGAMLAVEASSITITGADAGLVVGRTLNAAPGQYDLIGADASLVKPASSRSINAEPGAYTLAGAATRATLEADMFTGPNPNDVWSHPVEAGMSAEEILRIIAAALAGKVSGANGPNIAFTGLDGATKRIDATVDGTGNRLGVTVDGS